jgi:hypothetical protein
MLSIVATWLSLTSAIVLPFCIGCFLEEHLRNSNRELGCRMPRMC